MRTLIGCCLIHLAIGSVYSMSVLYPAIINLTGWNNSMLITGFALTILALGLTASLHQRFVAGASAKSVLINATILWVLSQWGSYFSSVILPSYSAGLTYDYYFWSILLGISIGLLYVIPINLITACNFKRTGLASGLVVCCFGLGSIIAARLFSAVDPVNLCWVYAAYFILMRIGTVLIQTSSCIQHPTEFQRNSTWYMLAVLFFMNIGVGISLLSNLSQLTVNNGFTLEDAVMLVALAGVANTLGRLLYSAASDYIGKLNMLGIILLLQWAAVITMMSTDFWRIPVVLIISVYGGVFAIMPSLMKQLYNTPTAYSQILAVWGLAGLIYPVVFTHIGMMLLIISSSLLVAIYCIMRSIHE